MKRYPFGIPAWAYWVLALVVAGVATAAPVPVGPILFGLVVVAAVVYFFFGVKPEKDRRFRVYKPVPVTGQAEFKVDRLDVVGESNYMVPIGQAVAVGGRDLEALLLWEPKNPFDQFGTAVRVDLVVDGVPYTCGYVPARISGHVADVVKGYADRGLATVVPASVFGGTSDKPNYGVILGSGVKRGRKPRFSAS